MRVLFVCVPLFLASAPEATSREERLLITGELEKWHRITLTLDGPESSEAAVPNPFTNYRLEATFTNGERRYLVPGYFAADGDAAETGADGGSKWRVHFAPDAVGAWSYVLSFRQGAGVAVSDDLGAGRPVDGIDGLTGSFQIAPSTKRARGRLEYTGEHYLRWAETGEPFLKQGADAPENLLAYADFDGDFKSDGHKDKLVKTWEPHVRDWRPGDPTWQEGKGKGLIGAINYLASEGMNAFSFLTLNIGGDDRNVFPYTSYDERERFDISRLDQWEVVFEHGDRLGMFLHFKTQETENETLLDGGETGPHRKLYYRELIARFGHHLALNWNLGEENGWGEQGRDQTTEQRLAMARYFAEHDPYGHSIVIHNGRAPDDLLGPDSPLTGYSLQTNRTDFGQVHGEVVRWVRRSAKAGKPWVVACDEPGDATHSLLPDAEDPEHDDARRNGLWGCLLGGGAGNEWYFGYQHAHSDLTCQDWRSRDRWWDQCRIALEFFEEHLPVAEMTSHDELTGSERDFCLAQPGEVYAVLLRGGDETELELGEGDESYRVEWFDPRAGGSLQVGSVATIHAPGAQELGRPPRDEDRDWIALVRRERRITPGR